MSNDLRVKTFRFNIAYRYKVFDTRVSYIDILLGIACENIKHSIFRHSTENTQLSIVAPGR